MFSRCYLVTSLVLLCPSPLYAQISTIALSGDAATGVAGAEWQDFQLVTLNNQGAIATRATLAVDGAIVTSSNNSGVWLFDQTSDTLIAREGTGMVPTVAGADFDQFNQVSLNNSGDIWVSGSLVPGVGGVSSSNRLGIWQYSSTTGNLVARSGAGVTPGTVDANYQFFSSPVSIASDEHISFRAAITSTTGSVTNNNNTGIWNQSSTGTPTLVAREGLTLAPGTTDVNYNLFSQTSTNSNNQLVIQASLQVGGVVTLNNSSGIWRYTGTTGELLARTGSGGVPSVPGLDFSQLGNSAINDPGHVAVLAQLSDSSSGVWLYEESSSTLLARSSTLGVPGIPAASYSSFESLAINNLDQVLVAAELEIDGTAGVTLDNNQGLWLLNNSPVLIARTGNNNVPGVLGASFSSFGEHALNNLGQVAFLADLTSSSGSIDATNDTGLWVTNSAGESVLVAREGDQLAGQTISGLNFFGGNPSQPGNFNDQGQLAFVAEFTSGDSGLFLFDSLLDSFNADFDLDNDVDSDDLALWQTAYGTLTGVSADDDADADGADFLIWQNEFGLRQSSLLSAVSVPEPSSSLLIAFALLNISVVSRRRFLDFV